MGCTKRGQASIESLITVSIIIMISLFTYLFLVNPSAESAADLRLSLKADGICRTIADAVNLAERSGNGFHTTFSVPILVEGTRLINSTVEKTFVQVSFRSLHSNSSVFCPIQAGRVRLELNPPRNTSMAYLVREGCLYNYLQNFSPLVYCSASYQDVGCQTSDPCQSMTDQQRNVSYNNFLIGLKNGSFDFVIEEDPHLTGFGLNYSQDYVYSGGTLYSSEHWGTTGNLFGVNFQSGGGQTMTIISVSDVIPGMHVGNVVELGSTPYRITTQNLNVTIIGVDEADDTIFARVSYGSGWLYWFPDYDAITTNGSIDFDSSVTNGINRTYIDLGLYSDTPFQLNNTTYEVFNSNSTVFVRVIS